MPSSTLTFQVSHTFLFAYTESTLIRHAYGTDGISPFERPQTSRLNGSALEHLAFILSGYDFAAEAWTTSSTRSREVRVASNLNDDNDHAATFPQSSWTISSSSKGKPGMEMYARRQGTETPFATSAESHTCCVKLTSPVFADTLEGWHAFAASGARIMGRLQQPGHLSLSNTNTAARGDQHLAWVNKTCGFSVVVRPAGGGDGETISWPALQNLYATWDLHDGAGCGNSPQKQELCRRGQRVRHHIYAFPTLRTYLESPLQLSRLEESKSSQISLMTTDGKDATCTAVKFDEACRPGGLHMKELQPRAQFIVQTVEACRKLAAAGRKV
ncbi:MAG: hypothetical protein Q9220_002957 [cf. Caloplaca sp. 1 TL-2023]